MSTEEKIMRNKVGLLKLSEMLGSGSEACKVMGYSRDSFYFYKAYDRVAELERQCQAERIHSAGNDNLRAELVQDRQELQHLSFF